MYNGFVHPQMTIEDALKYAREIEKISPSNLGNFELALAGSLLTLADEVARIRSN